MKGVSLVKLGGSVITDKTKPYTPNMVSIKRLSRAISKAHKAGEILILGTGAGSFGHCPVLKYKINKGVKTKKQVLGFALTQSRVTVLNNLVVEALIRNGVPAVSVHPSSVVVASGGKVKQFHLDTILGIFKLGAVPVVHGDMVVDVKWGGCVVSTEDLFEELVKRLPKRGIPINKAIYVSDSKGIIDRRGKLIENISHGSKNIFNDVGLAKGYDVTGGMRSKLKSSLELARRGIPVYVIGASGEDQILKAIRGERVGTKIS